MPYCRNDDKEFYQQELGVLAERMYQGAHISPGETGSLTDGVLTFLLTRVVEEYRSCFGDSYHTFNEIRGALANTSSEFYRRVMAPYEDRKRVENGDVYKEVPEPPF